MSDSVDAVRRGFLGMAGASAFVVAVLVALGVLGVGLTIGVGALGFAALVAGGEPARAEQRGRDFMSAECEKLGMARDCWPVQNRTCLDQGRLATCWIPAEDIAAAM